MTRSFLVLVLAMAALVLASDQLSKAWALELLRVEGASVDWPGPLALTLVFNQSNAFGFAPDLGELSRWGLTFMNLAVAALLLILVSRRDLRPLEASGFALIAAGAIGNAVDRVRFGAVVDFLDATEIGFVWVFNIADAAIDLGIGLWLLGALLTAWRARSRGRAAI